VVAGSSSGIGAAISARLLELGFTVVGMARRPQSDVEGLVPVQIDLSRLDHLPDQLDRLASVHADTSVLVLCAGRGDFGSLEELSYDRIRALVELNLIAHLYLCRAFLPGMKRRGRGHVVVVGSEAALRGRRAGTVYCATKFGLRGMGQALRDEVARSGVRVTQIHPGMVGTPFFDPLDFEPGGDEENQLVPSDVADAVELAVEARRGTVFDEIELSPLKRVVRKKERRGGSGR